MATVDECKSVTIKYKGDGSTVLYPFPFTYMSYDDIVVFVYDEQTKTWENREGFFVFANATTVEFLTAPPAPTINPDIDNIWITRRTDLDAMIATFYPGSSIRAQDLNDDFDQLRLAIQEGRCKLQDGLTLIDDKTWNIDETITRPDQEAGAWIEHEDDFLATSDAIMARHDVHVRETLPPKPTVEQTGKGWQNTDDCWSSYWNPQSKTWVAYVNSGVRGAQGVQGPPGLSIVGPPGPPGPDGPSGGTFPDAPADGTVYGRQDNNWTAVTASGSISVVKPLKLEDNILSFDLQLIPNIP